MVNATPAGLPAGAWSARYSGEIALAATGTYGFALAATAGSARLLVDDVVVADTALAGGSGSRANTFPGRHRVRVDFSATGASPLLTLNPSTSLSCPVTAARAWMARTAIASGPVFRSVDRHGRLGPGRLSGKGVAAVVKRAALAAGLDPAFFAGHSLRAGHVTQAKRNDATDLEVMSQTHHRSAELREAELFRHTSARRLGL